MWLRAGAQGSCSTRLPPHQQSHPPAGGGCSRRIHAQMALCSNLRPVPPAPLASAGPPKDPLTQMAIAINKRITAASHAAEIFGIVEKARGGGGRPLCWARCCAVGASCCKTVLGIPCGSTRSRPQHCRASVPLARGPASAAACSLPTPSWPNLRRCRSTSGLTLCAWPPRCTSWPTCGARPTCTARLCRPPSSSASSSSSVSAGGPRLLGMRTLRGVQRRRHEEAHQVLGRLVTAALAGSPALPLCPRPRLAQWSGGASSRHATSPTHSGRWPRSTTTRVRACLLMPCAW